MKDNLSISHLIYLYKCVKNNPQDKGAIDSCIKDDVEEWLLCRIFDSDPCWHPDCLGFNSN
jgi:hypothetical protein